MHEEPYNWALRSAPPAAHSRANDETARAHKSSAPASSRDDGVERRALRAGEWNGTVAAPTVGWRRIWLVLWGRRYFAATAAALRGSPSAAARCRVRRGGGIVVVDVSAAPSIEPGDGRGEGAADAAAIGRLFAIVMPGARAEGFGGLRHRTSRRSNGRSASVRATAGAAIRRGEGPLPRPSFATTTFTISTTTAAATAAATAAHLLSADRAHRRRTGERIGNRGDPVDRAACQVQAGVSG